MGRSLPSGRRRSADVNEDEAGRRGTARLGVDPKAYLGRGSSGLR